MQKDVLKKLLSKEYAAQRRKEIDMNKAAREYGPTRDFSGNDLGDTIYMAAADGQGNVISFIQSLFGSFGASPGQASPSARANANSTGRRASPIVAPPAAPPVRPMAAPASGLTTPLSWAKAGMERPSEIAATEAIRVFFIVVFLSCGDANIASGKGSGLGKAALIRPLPDERARRKSVPRRKECDQGEGVGC